MEQTNFIESLREDSIIKRLLADPQQFPFKEYQEIFQEEYDNRYKWRNINVGKYHFQNGQVSITKSASALFRSPELIISLITKDNIFYQKSFESFGKQVNFVALPANEDGSVEIRGIVGKFFMFDKELDIKISVYDEKICHISILVFKIQ